MGLVAALPVAAQQSSLPAPLREAGDDVIEGFRSGNLSAVESHFGAAITKVLTHERFVASAVQVDARFGPLLTCSAPDVRRSGQVTVADYPCEFGKGPMTLRLAWDDAAELVGYFYQPPPVAAIALPASVREEAVTVGAKGWPLPGTLFVPTRVVRPPIAVFVHGSGPNDRDETIGPNKPFRDLAIGFAARGIASLRYDKRTLALADRFHAETPQWTLDDQIVDDAVAAVAAAAARSDVGPVFIVGHSEGAWLAPRVAERATAAGIPVAGIVMLAGNVTPLADLIVEQVEFASKLPLPRAAAADVDDMRVRRDHVRQLVVADNERKRATLPQDLTLPLDIPASAWLDIARYDPAVALLAEKALPALLTFGERDFQVPIREKALWEWRLGARPNTTVVAFPSINHLLIEGSGPMSADEYLTPGHVSKALIDRVSTWIVETRAASHRAPGAPDG